MGTDIIQNALFKGTRPKGMELEITRESGFLSGSKDIFDLLQAEKPVPARKEMLDVLRAAYSMIEQAEKTISNQNKRIENLEGLLTTDELTKLANRRGFYEAFRREFDRTNRGQSEGGLLIMIDLDNFKTINDTYGHAAGDAALRLVAEFLRSEIRDMDIAARLGGDEFIVIFPNASKEKAMKRAQLMGLRLNNLSLIWGIHEIRIGASLGLKDYKKGDTLDSIIAGADHGMYINKKNRKEAKA
jgi:diguanylate cyclase (GGDEF)-like protein